MNIRIFFSSPSDVQMERETAKRIVDRLQSEVGERASIQPYFWEHEVMVATRDYQENIPHMDDFDIVVCILWSRLGTPLDPARHPKPGGGGFKSGTEYEFFTAMQAHELKGTPDIFVFRNMTEPRRPSRPKEVREAVDKEIDRLDSFFESYFEDNEFFTRAINIYSTLGEFEEKLTIALRSYLTGRIPVSGARKTGLKRPTYQRQPYLGLASFDYEDAPVFFGRTAQVGEIITVLQTQELEAQTDTESPPKHFVMILGSSGSGKSSLARAGVLPMLTNPGVIEGATAWRTAIFKPGDQSGDPVLALVDSLNTPRGLPELFADGTKPSELADLIRSQPQGGGLLLRQALTQAGALALEKKKRELTEKLELLIDENRDEDARDLREKISSLATPSVRIALLADQLEELFTSDLSPEKLKAFIGILIALANSGRVFLLATLRSDFYPKCLEHPDLIALMQGSGTYALPAPSAVDIGQMIRQPAAIAGLTFEENPTTGESLDELLRDSALKDPSALPLLSYTLEQLYEQRSKDGLLTLKTYRDLGGLEGAIGSRAESIFTKLPIEAQAAFDGLSKQLVALQKGGEPTRRRAIYATLTRTSESNILVDALVSARLLTADQSASGERVISVAHEALLRHWPRLVAWVEENRLFLNTRTRVTSRMSDWLEKDQSEDYLIPRGPNLAAAESILSGHLTSLDPLEIEFIRKSSELVRRQDQKRLRNARLITAGAIALCLIAVAGGLLAMAAKRTAQKNEERAQQSAMIANETKQEAVSSEARASYILGVERLEAGRNRDGLTSLAQTLALDPKARGALSRIYSEMLYSLPRPIPIRSITASSQMRQRISGCYSGGNEYVTYIAADKSPEVFDLKTMSVIEGPWSDQKKTVASALTYKSDIILDVQEDGDGYSYRCWNLKTKKPGAVLTIGPREFFSMLVTVDGKHFVIATTDGSVKLISTETGETITEWKQEGSTAWVTEIPEKYIVSTFSEEIVIYDMVTKEKKRIQKSDDFSFVDSRITLNSGRFCVQSAKLEGYKSTSRFSFYDAATAALLEDSRVIELNEFVADFRPDNSGNSVAVALMGKGPRIFNVFDESKDQIFDDVYSADKVGFSHNGRHFIAATEDGAVNILDLKTMAPAFAPVQTDGKLEDLVMTWNGRYLLTASGKVATIWDLSVGKGLSQPMSFRGTAQAVSVGEDQLVVQTNKNIQRFDTLEMEREPVMTMFQYINPLVSASMNRTSVNLGEGWVKFLKSSPGDDTEVETARWLCPSSDYTYSNFSDDGSLFVRAINTKCVVVDPEDGSLLSEFTLPGRGAFFIFISPDNRYIVNLCQVEGMEHEFVLHLWDLQEGKEVTCHFEDNARSQIRGPYVAFSPDSRFLAIATSGKGGETSSSTFLWDLHDATQPAKEFDNPGVVTQMEFSEDGTFIATASFNNGLQIRSVETGKPLAVTTVPGGVTIGTFAISPDCDRIAIAVTKEIDQAIPTREQTPSEIRIWDWREALPVSRAFQIPTTVSHLRFSKDGRKIFAIFPQPGEAEESIVQGWETEPSPELAPLLFPLVQAAIAYNVVPGRLPELTNPFELWQKVRQIQRYSWFFQSPEDRSISPAFGVKSMRWIEDNLVEIETLLAAMPCVALSNAAIAHWRRSYLNNLIYEIGEMDTSAPEFEAESKKINDLRDTIERLKMIPERSPDSHSLIPYYLSMLAQNENDEDLRKKYALLAYERNPDNADCAEIAANVYEDEGDYKSALPIFKKLRELRPEVDLYRLHLGTAQWEIGEKTAAQAEFAAVVNSESIEESERGFMLIRLGRPAEAMTLFQKIADEQKNASSDSAYDSNSFIYLVVGQYSNGDHEAAIESYRQLIALAPIAADAKKVGIKRFHPLIKECLLETLKLTLAEYPDLLPEGDE